MKKLFTLTIMLITLAMNAQDYSHASNPVSEVVIFKGTDANGLEGALTVPEGGFITFSHVYNINGTWAWVFPDGTTSSNYYTALPEGYKFYFEGTGSGAANSFVIVYAHEYASTRSTFSYNEAELDNSIKLFPNPTTSEVALNS